MAVAALVSAWALGLFGLGKAAAQEGRAASRTAPYVHVVIVPLKKDAPKDAADALITDAYEMLGKIPSVRAIQAGKRAEKFSAEFAKRDFDVGLLLLFDDYEGLEVYLKHPLHLKYVEKHVKNVDESRLSVYDFTNPKK
jgi:hypothetical protein